MAVLSQFLVSVLFLQSLRCYSFDIFGFRLPFFRRTNQLPPSLLPTADGGGAPVFLLSQVEDDGYSLRGKSLMARLTKQTTEPGTLILVRHGQTTMNYNKTFTGWIDVDLSANGKLEVEHAARLLLEKGYTVDVTYTSRLKRAIRSSWIILKELGQIYRPVYKSYRLNERMYGALEGQSKLQSCIDLGEETIQQYRSGLYARPPPMTPEHPHWHASETKYLDLDPSEIPLTESLQDTIERTRPLLEKRIMPDIMNGKTVMVVAHANSIRGVLKYIDQLTEEQIKKVGIPNGIPLIFRFELDRKTGKLKPIVQPKAVPPLSGEFLEKKNLLRIMMAREADMAAKVPFFYTNTAIEGGETDGPDVAVPAISTAWPSLLRRLDDGATVEEEEVEDDAMSFLNKGSLLSILKDPVVKGLSTLDRDRKLVQQIDSLTGAGTAPTTATSVDTGTPAASTGATPVPSTTTTPASRSPEPVSPQPPLVTAALYCPHPRVHPGVGNTPREDPVVVIIRHGKTEYNKLGLFTGWEDVGLADEGRCEAIAAGKLIKLHGFTFDVVYTSWLSRAIETAWLVLDELDLLWLPIIKSWRLNERMYGALTGLSKQMIAQRHGDAQFKKWRRGYSTRPPPISSFSASYPGNDDRYVSNVLDVRYSVFESLIRSIGHRRFELHRKFPKSESLKDCMQRTIPYFTGKIVPQSIAQGKNVLIASSENAIRGLLMHLCEIPPERISEVEIPTGLPLVFNTRTKCIQVLDDGVECEGDPLSRYDFGSSPELLFRPCDSSLDDSCVYVEGGKSYAFDPIRRLPVLPPAPFPAEKSVPTNKESVSL